MPRETRIADRLRLWSLRVVEVDGWRTRGSETFTPRGVVLHHTAGAATGDMPSLRVLVEGRPDLPGPLAQVGLGRSGTCFVVAAGKGNHAGAGGWRGLSGNASVFGIEAENDGRQPWTAAQLAVYPIAAAALVSLTPARDPELVCAHREWAPGRKVDPHSIDMARFRADVRRLLERPSPPPPPPSEVVVDLVRRQGTVEVYAVMGDGQVLVHITGLQYAQMGTPPVRDLPAGDPLFTRPRLTFPVAQ